MKSIRLIVLLVFLMGIGFHIQAEEKTDTKIYVNLWHNELYLIKNGETAVNYPIALDQTVPRPLWATLQ